MWNILQFIFLHPLTKTSRIRSFVRFLSWQVRCRLSEEVRVSWVGGTQLAARRGMTGITGNIYVGLHEFADMMFLLHFLRSGDLFIDVGANVGSYTILASGVRSAKTMAFEPDPDTLQFLNRNIEVNSLEDHVTVHEMAVGAEDAMVGFTKGLGAINQVTSSDAENVRLVPQKRLDDVLRGYAPIMMKIDVEGYEENAILGARDVLSNKGLKIVILEAVSDTVEIILYDHDFERMYYDPFNIMLTNQENDVIPTNLIYVRDREFVNDRNRNSEKIRIFDQSI